MLLVLTCQADRRNEARRPLILSIRRLLVTVRVRRRSTRRNMVLRVRRADRAMRMERRTVTRLIMNCSNLMNEVVN